MRSNNLIAVLLLLAFIFNACTKKSGELFDESGNRPLYPDKKLELLKKVDLFDFQSEGSHVVWPRMLSLDGIAPFLFVFDQTHLSAVNRMSGDLIWRLDLRQHIQVGENEQIQEITEWNDQIVVRHTMGFLILDSQNGQVQKSFLWSDLGIDRRFVIGMVSDNETIFLLNAISMGSFSQIVVYAFDFLAEVFNPIYLNQNGANTGLFSGGFFYDAQLKRLVFLHPLREHGSNVVHVFLLDPEIGLAESFPVPAARSVDRSLPIVYQNQVLYWNSWDFHAFSVAERRHLYNIAHRSIKVGRHFVYGQPTGFSGLRLFNLNTGFEQSLDRNQFMRSVTSQVLEHFPTKLLAVMSEREINLYDPQNGEWLIQQEVAVEDSFKSIAYLESEYSLLFRVNNNGVLSVYRWPFR